MVFGYRHVTISGSLEGTEGTIAFIRELKDYMEEVGWTTTDDRTSQAGGTYPNTSKLVMQSNGEDGEYPTFYLEAISGTSAGAGQNYTVFLMETAYDTSTHQLPSSGVASNQYNTLMARLNTRTDEDFEAFFSGDSEAMVIVTKQLGLAPQSSYDAVYIGRANSFRTTAENPYPLYLVSGSSTGIVATDVSNGFSTRGVGGNPPIAYDSNNMRMWYYQNIDTANQPYTIGDANSIYLAVPWLLSYYSVDLVDEGRGVMGTIRNGWLSAGANSGMYWENQLTASGTSGVQTYLVFPTGAATDFGLIIRET